MLTPIVVAAPVFVAPALDAADADEADQTRGADHVAESTRVERPYALAATLLALQRPPRIELHFMPP